MSIEYFHVYPSAESVGEVWRLAHIETGHIMAEFISDRAACRALELASELISIRHDEDEIVIANSVFWPALQRLGFERTEFEDDDGNVLLALGSE